MERVVAPGGWRRGVVGVAIGVVIGGLLTAALPREPRRGAAHRS